MMNNEMLSANDVFKMLGIKSTLFREMVADGRFAPEPIRFGRRKLWRTQDVKNWINNGCNLITNSKQQKVNCIMNTEKQECQVCKQTLPIEYFVKFKNNPNTRKPFCLACLEAMRGYNRKSHDSLYCFHKDCYTDRLPLPLSRFTESVIIKGRKGHQVSCQKCVKKFYVDIEKDATRGVLETREEPIQPQEFVRRLSFAITGNNEMREKFEDMIWVVLTFIDDFNQYEKNSNEDC